VERWPAATPQRVGNAASSRVALFPEWSVILLRTRRSTKANENFSFIRDSLFVEHSPGGIYLSGQTSNPANRRHLRIGSSVGLGRSFSEFRTCRFGQKCASSLVESRRTKECTDSGKTRDLGSKSTSIEALSLRRRPQII
jgi:hypothetical protein